MCPEKTSNTEKVSVNLTPVETGQIDVLVEQGFYTNRSDFIRMATRLQLDKHAKDIEFGLKGILPDNFDGEKETKTSLLAASAGIVKLNQKELKRVKARGVKLVIKMAGVLIITSDVSVALAKETIQSIKVYGVIRAADEIKNLFIES